MCHDSFMYVPWLLHIDDERYEKPSLGSSAAESCRIFMSHVTYKWVMSRMNFSCLCIHMSHVTSYVWHESCNFICVTWHAIPWVPQQQLILPPLVLRHVADTWDMSRMSTCHERRRSTRHVTYDMSRMSHGDTWDMSRMSTCQVGASRVIVLFHMCATAWVHSCSESWHR